MAKRETGDGIQAVFIDRDGTIGGTGRFVHPNEFEVFPFVPEALSLLKSGGIKILACTNQNRISEGRATEDDFRREFTRLGFDDAYICPHPLDSECDCRKPRVGLPLRAARDYDLDLRYCVFIGDTGATDMVAAERVGEMKVLVRTGWGESSLREYRHTWATVDPDYVAEDLLDAARWVLAQNEHIKQVGPPSATNASVACIDDGRVLLIRRSLDEHSFAGFWEFPGGKVEFGETPAEAAVREFREECGSDVIIEGKVATFSWVSDGQRKTEVVFSGRTKGPIMLGKDHSSYAWAGLDDLIEGRFTCSPEVRSIAMNLCR